MFGVAPLVMSTIAMLVQFFLEENQRIDGGSIKGREIGDRLWGERLGLQVCVIGGGEG